MNIEIRKSTWVAVLGVLTLITIVSSIAVPTLALKYYFNCTTKAANKSGKFSVEDVNTCYYKVFVGARKYYVNETRSALSS